MYRLARLALLGIVTLIHNHAIDPDGTTASASSCTVENTTQKRNPLCNTKTCTTLRKKNTTYISILLILSIGAKYYRHMGTYKCPGSGLQADSLYQYWEKSLRRGNYWESAFITWMGVSSPRQLVQQSYKMPMKVYKKQN